MRLLIILHDYFLAVLHLKMKLGYSMFAGLEISKTNKFCKFYLFQWQHDDFKMAVFFTFFFIFQISSGKIF